MLSGESPALLADGVDAASIRQVLAGRLLVGDLWRYLDGPDEFVCSSLYRFAALGLDQLDAGTDIQASACPQRGLR